MTNDEMTCKVLVEVVTDYLEGAMPPADRTRLEGHLKTCPGCVNYIDQMRETLRIMGCIPPESVQPEAKEELLEVFRKWKRARSAD